MVRYHFIDVVCSRCHAEYAMTIQVKACPNCGTDTLTAKEE